MKLNFTHIFVATGTLSAFLMIDPVLELYFLSPGVIYGFATVLFLPFFKYYKHTVLKRFFARTIWVISSFVSFTGAFYSATFLYEELGEKGTLVVLSAAGFVGATILLIGVCIILHILKLKVQWLFAFLILVAGTVTPIIATLTLVGFLDGFLALFLLWQCVISILFLHIIDSDHSEQYTQI